MDMKHTWENVGRSEAGGQAHTWDLESSTEKKRKTKVTKILTSAGERCAGWPNLQGGGRN